MPRALCMIAVLTAAAFMRAASLSLEVRVFSGTDEVSSQTRLTIHRAGERDQPIAQIPSGSARLQIDVPAGIYDAQAIRELEGRVVNIRWAERLVVMPYPDEAGHHLEVINFQNGYGALEVRQVGTPRAEVALFVPGERQKEAAAGIEGAGYMLFVLTAGRYDLRARTNSASTWQTGIEIPLDRTRLWILR